MTGEWREERKTTGYEILEEVILEVQRLKRGPRLVPTCNSALIYGNYWILHHLSQLLSFFPYCSLSCLSDSCAINLPSTFSQFWHLAPIFTLFSSLLFTISPPHAPLSCLLSSWAFSSCLCALASSGILQSLCSDGQGLNAMLEMIMPFCSCTSVCFFCFPHPL